MSRGTAMRLATWNINRPAARRAPGIAGHLAGLDADVVVLTEYRPLREGGRMLAAQLRAAGWSHQVEAPHCGDCNTVRIASRIPLETTGSTLALDLPVEVLPQLGAR